VRIKRNAVKDGGRYIQKSGERSPKMLYGKKRGKEDEVGRRWTIDRGTNQRKKVKKESAGRIREWGGTK